MRFLLFAVFFGCGGTIAAGSDAGTNDAASDAPIPDAGFKSSLSFEGFGQGTFFGSFYANAQQATGGCQQTSSGACTVSSCAAVGPQTLASAGTLTLTVNGSSVATSTPNVQGGGYYMTSPLVFAPGDVLGVSGSGADVPAFATRTITAPSKIAVATPSVISTSQDLTLTWTGGESDAKVIIGIARGAFNGSTSVSCTFDATAGTGTVPKAQLASMQSGVLTGNLTVGQQRTTTFASGAFVIDLSAIEDDDSYITFQQ